MRYLSVLFLFLSLNVYSQTALDREKSVSINSWAISKLINNSEEVDGTPYLFPKLMPITVVLKEGSKYNMNGNIDIHKSDFIFENQENRELFKAENPYMFEYLDFAGKKFIYKRYQEGGLFFEVLLENDANAILKNYKKKFVEKKISYNAFVSAHYKELKETYYILDKKTNMIIPILSSRGKFAQEISNMFGKDKKAVQQFLKKSKFDVNNSKSLESLLNYLAQ